MKSNEIDQKINQVKEHLSSINQLMEELHKFDVEIKIMYKDALSGEPPKLEIWKAIAHVDYLK